MESLQQLLERYGKTPQIDAINNLLGADQVQRILLDGLSGSQESFVLHQICVQTNKPILIFGDDKEQAAYIYDNLRNISTDLPVYFLPDSFKRPLNFERPDTGNALRRTEIVNRISGDSGKYILVTYPEAIFEQLVSPEILEGGRVKISRKEILDIDFLIEILVEYGFERVDFVYEPGQFSIRGGIFDIFSYGNEWPYRVELFDDEVESIRLFDPMDQRSIREIASVSIVPDVNKNFSESQKSSLLEIIQQDALVALYRTDNFIERLQKCFEAFESFSKEYRITEDEWLKIFIAAKAFVTTGEILDNLENRTILFLHAGTATNQSGLREIRFNSSPQPEFNKNFNLLIQAIQKKQSEGYTHFIFTDNKRQIERFYAIFEDLEAHIQFIPVFKAIKSGFIDHEIKVVCYTDHQIFQRFHRYKLKRGFSKSQALSLRMLRELQPGDFITHIDHGVGRYSGLEKIEINGHKQESVRILYKNNDILYVSINTLHKISKYVGKDGTAPRLDKLGSDAWLKLKSRTKRKVKDIANELIKLYAKRRASQGFAFPEDGYLQNELEASFMFEDTPDQYTATVEVKEDMCKPNPMDRLICGDVGFGKTEIAVRASFKAVIAGKQVAILVPTTILALQHFRTFKERLDEFDLKIDYLNRFRSSKEKRIIFERLKAGEIDIIIGTHGLLNKDIGFKDLGLLIIDEEQKFGVSAKEKLRNLKVNVDTLTLTATPIPRTLQFSLMAARDMSILRTAPPNRQPIHTEVRVFNEHLVREAIYFELNRGGQVYYVHNRVKSLHETHAMIHRLCPDVDIVLAHGQMDPKLLEKTLVEFIDRKHDILLCTNIIETGLDIPNVNTIIVSNAHHFGLSDLHQLRGRVGRSNRKAYCYLFSPPVSTLTPDARKRLRTLEEFSELGSGFNIAMRDLDIRGAGNMLGAEQSGFISDIGYETFQKILDEAIQELKQDEFKDLFKEEFEKKGNFIKEVTIDSDIEMLIPDDYVSNTQERLNLYTQLDTIEEEKGIIAFAEEMIDRFGPIPEEVFALFDALRLRWSCQKLGFERLIYKNGTLRCFFLSNHKSLFYETEKFQQILAYLSTRGAQSGLQLKQRGKNLILVKEHVKSTGEVKELLEKINDVTTGSYTTT